MINDECSIVGSLRVPGEIVVETLIALVVISCIHVGYLCTNGHVLGNVQELVAVRKFGAVLVVIQDSDNNSGICAESVAVEVAASLATRAAGALHLAFVDRLGGVANEATLVAVAERFSRCFCKV